MTTQMQEGSRETLHVLELDRTPRPQKLAAERAYFDGAHEVRFSERSFRPHHGASLDDVRAFVDSLEVRRREVPALPDPPVVGPLVVPPKIPTHFRAPLEAVIRGALISVETVHRVGTGTVVDVAWESEDEGERRGLFVVEDDVARPYDAVASRIDALPPPDAATASNAPAAPATPAKKGLLGRFGKKESAAGPEPATPAPDEAPKKRRFGFGNK